MCVAQSLIAIEAIQGAPRRGSQDQTQPRSLQVTISGIARMIFLYRFRSNIAPPIIPEYRKAKSESGS
jgi:hypothetical protein